MTDEIERDVARMLRNRVADLPATHEVAPGTVARAHRRRAVKIGAFATAVVVVVAGTAAAVAQAARNDTDHVSTTTPTTVPAHRATVDTVRCPVTYAITPDQPWPPPSTAPRTLSVAGGNGLVSYAATTDDRYIVLGPKGWRCSATFAVDGQNGMVIDANGNPGTDRAAISVVNGFLWHGGVGSTLACSVSDAAAVKAYLRANYPELGPCPAPHRVLTHVDAHSTTFVDPDGARGAGWIVLPSSSTADDGKVSVLTCRPTTGLTAADCDTIVADWLARVRELALATGTTTTTAPAGPATVSTTACPATYALTGGPTLPPPSTAPRAVTVPGAGALTSYAATTDPRYIVLGPTGWQCSAAVAADGDNGMAVTPNGTVGASDAAISIINDYLWHGFVGVGEACKVFTDSEVQRQAQGAIQCVVPAGRTVTRVDSHVSTFEDADGARGAGWIVLPSSSTADDGNVSVLTCRPTTGLTSTDCDAIIADWIARVDTPAAPGP